MLALPNPIAVFFTQKTFLKKNKPPPNLGRKKWGQTLPKKNKPPPPNPPPPPKKKKKTQTKKKPPPPPQKKTPHKNPPPPQKKTPKKNPPPPKNPKNHTPKEGPGLGPPMQNHVNWPSSFFFISSAMKKVIPGREARSNFRRRSLFSSPTD